jgi:predicted transcriptional regulator
MSKFPVYIRLGADIRRAAEILSISAVGDLMVLDYDNQFVGVLSESDLLRSLLPTFDEVLRAGGALDDAFQFVVQKGREIVGRQIDPLVNHDAITVKSTDEIAQAAVVMLERHMRSLPVVEDGALVGAISRADICRALIYHA